ncbi:MAG: TrmH family RNA methyltransferase [Bacteroidota bacterium]
MTQQLHHDETQNSSSKVEIVLCCTEISSPANLGSIFRLADAFGVKSILLNEQNTELLQSNRFKRTARSTDKTLIVETTTSVFNSLNDFKKNDYQILALELTTTSQALKNIKPDKKIVLLLGNENTGIPAEYLKIAVASFHIPMYGKNSSINVAQATGIALYEIQQKVEK